MIFYLNLIKNYIQIFRLKTKGAITDAAGFNIFTLSDKTIQNVVNSYFDESGKHNNTGTQINIFFLISFFY